LSEWVNVYSRRVEPGEVSDGISPSVNSRTLQALSHRAGLGERTLDRVCGNELGMADFVLLR